MEQELWGPRGPLCTRLRVMEGWWNHLSHPRAVSLSPLGLLWQLRPSDVEVELLAHTRDVVSRDLPAETGLHTGWVENGGLFIASNKQRLDEYKRLMSVGRSPLVCVPWPWAAGGGVYLLPVRAGLGVPGLWSSGCPNDPSLPTFPLGELCVAWGTLLG